jgi:hypothetical protein
MKDLFTARLFVELADKLCEMDPTTPADLLQMTRMAVSSREVSGTTRLNIVDGIKHRNIGNLLCAFWTHYTNEIGLYPTSTRLLINPPLGLDVKADHFVTIKTQKFLNGKYGEVIEHEVSDLFHTEGVFNDVAIFWGAGIDSNFARQLVTHRVDVGTTITLLTPSQLHDFWLTWARYDSGIGNLMEVLGQRFQSVSLHRTECANVITEILGMQQLPCDIQNPASDRKSPA